MAVPVVTTGADQEYAFSASPQTINLTASATGTPTGYTWTMMSVPEGSTANVGVNGDFTDGVSTVQNPSFDTDGDIYGSWVLECVATNIEGASKPVLDRENCQTLIRVRSPNEDIIPNDYQFASWGKAGLNKQLRKLIDQNLLATKALSFWVDFTSGSDTNSGVDATKPLQSFSALQKILPKESAYNVVVNISGTATTKQYLTTPKLINEAHFLIDGGSSVTDIVASTAATSQTDGSITVAAAGWTAKAYEGSFVEILSGAYAGQTRVIGESTTDTIKFTQDISGLGAAPLANFRIYKPATNFNEGFAINNALNHGNAFAEVRLQRFTSDKKINIGAGTFSINNLIATDPVEEFGIETERGTHLHAINTGYYDPTTFIQDADKACSFGGTGIKVCTGGNSVLDNIFTEKRLFCRVGQVFLNNIWLRGVIELVEAFVEIDGFDHLGGIPDAAGCVFEHCHVLFKNNININSEDIGIWAENCLIDTTSTTVLAGTCTNFGARFLKGTHMTLNPSMSVPTLSGGSGDFTPNEVAAGSWSTVLAGTPYAHYGESVIVRRNSDLAPNVVQGGPGSDTTAIHDNVAGEIAAVASKATPVSGDYLLIEDSAAANAKKRITLGDLPAGADVNAKVTASDTTTGYLNDKVNPSSGLQKAVGTPGGNETLDLTPVYGSSASTVCEGNDSRLSDARTPTGSASGDLGGTYPSPSVAALTTTSGPTSLTIGAVADGQVLTRSGTTVIGTTPSTTDADAIHDNVAAEINAVTEKLATSVSDIVLIEDSENAYVKKKASLSNLNVFDSTAIHDDQFGEISAVTEKVSPVGADILLIEDSADLYNKKKIQITNLPTGGGGPGSDTTAIHDDTAGEINAVAEKIISVSTDVVLIEDSEATYSKKKVQLSNLNTFDQSAIHDSQDAEISAIAEKVTPVSGDFLLIEDSEAAPIYSKKKLQIGNLPSGGGGPGSDTTAIHDDTAGEINAVAEKLTTVSTDVVLIEDSEATYNKKKVQLSNLNAYDANALHDNVDGEIFALTEKVSPVGADVLVIEDSEGVPGYDKKYIQISNLPGGATSPLTTKGDLYTYDTGDQRLPVGIDGQVLIADSVEATGLKWKTPGAETAVAGVSLDVFNTAPSGTKTKADATFASIDATNLKVDSVFPVAGKYLFTLKGQLEALTSGTDSSLRLVIDGGTGNEIATADLPGNLISAAVGAREEFALTWLIELTSGSHNVDVQWRRYAGTGTTSTDANSGWKLSAQLISGSGAGGAITDKSSVSGVSVTTVSPTWQDIITFDVVVADAEQILINVSGYGRPDSATQAMGLRVYDVTTSTVLISQLATTTDGTAGHEFLGCCFVTDALSAGNHQIKIQSTRSSSYPSANFVINEMVACITQFRGGLVPVSNNGSLVTSTPSGFDFVGDHVSVAINNNEARIQYTGETGNPVEEPFSTTGSETPGTIVSFPLVHTPTGNGAAGTPSGYHIIVFRNGVKMGYESPAPTSVLTYYYDVAANAVKVYASGVADDYEVYVVSARPANVAIASIYQEPSVIPVMTSNTTPEGIASANSELNPAWYAFSPLQNGWLANNTGVPAWLQYQFTTAKIIKSYAIQPWSLDTWPARVPTSWNLQGSNNGTTWTTLHSVSDRGKYDWSEWGYDVFSIQNDTAYLYYRITITDIGNGSGNPYPGLGGLKLFEEEPIYRLGHSPGWRYLNTILPTGFNGSIRALYQFDDSAESLNDRSGNLNNLTKISGTEQYTALNGLIGLSLDGSTYYKGPIDSSVQLTGDMTLELLCSLYAATQFYYLISAQGVVGTPPDAANNILWGIRGSGNKRKLNFLHETGTGGTYEQPDMLSHPVEGQMSLVTMVRSGTDYILYIDGKRMDTQAFTTPTSGGTSAKLVLGAREDGGNIFNDAVIYSVRLLNGAFTDAQAAESARRIRGLIL